MKAVLHDLLTKEVEDSIIKERRFLHTIPELNYEEFETAKYIANELRKIDGMEVKECVGVTGVIGLLSLSSSGGKCIMLRADMDALPIQEQKNDKKDYISKNDGKMHACGHDGHCSSLLNAARVIGNNRKHFSKNVGIIKFVFQPAEEGGAGAKKMIEEGVLENPHVDEVYGLHLWNYMPVNSIGIDSGAIMGSSDRFFIDVVGIGGHGSMPYGCVDSILVASQLVIALQTVVSRNVDPLQPSVLSIGHINGGFAPNVICDNVKLGGTVRSLNETNRLLIKKRLIEISEGVGKTYGAEIKVEYKDAYPITANHEVETEKVRKVACCVCPNSVMKPHRTLAAEDFSFFLKARPGCFFFIGSSPNELTFVDGKWTGIIIPHHRFDFDFDEKALFVATSMWLQLVEELLT